MYIICSSHYELVYLFDVTVECIQKCFQQLLLLFASFSFGHVCLGKPWRENKYQKNTNVKGQRTLNVQMLVSSLIGLDLTKEENMLLFECTESKAVKQKTTRTVIIPPTVSVHLKGPLWGSNGQHVRLLAIRFRFPRGNRNWFCCSYSCKIVWKERRK